MNLLTDLSFDHRSEYDGFVSPVTERPDDGAFVSPYDLSDWHNRRLHAAPGYMPD